MNEQKEDRMFNIFFACVCLCGVAVIVTLIWSVIQIVQWVVSK